MTTPRFGAVTEVYEGKASGWPSIRTLFSVERGLDRRLKLRAKNRLRSLVGGGGYPEVADFGCGDGSLLEALMRLAGVGRFAGIDSSRAMILKTHERLDAQSRSIKVDSAIARADDTPFESESFDITLAEYLLHHVPSPIGLLKKMARVTKRGGVMMSQAPGVGYQSAFQIAEGPWSKVFPNKKPNQLGNCDPLGRFSGEELEELVDEADLEIVSIVRDYCVYRFETPAHYLRFMVATGADSKLHGYSDSAEWIEPYAEFLSVLPGPIRVKNEFITVEAKKP